MSVLESTNNHLTVSYHNMIHSHPHCTEESGANYQYEGKVWNVTVGCSKNAEEEVTAIFVRVNSSEKLFGWRLFSKDGRIFQERGFKYNGVEASDNGQTPTSQSTKESNLFRSFAGNYHFDKILREGTLLEGHEGQSLEINNHYIEGVRSFFEECPELIPQCSIIQTHRPTERPIPTQSPPSGTSNSYWKWAVASSLFVIAAVYLVVKYHSQETSLRERL